MPLDGVLQKEVVLVGYSHDDWWHERCVFGFVALLSIVVVTPHWDMYLEDVADYESVHRLQADCTLPAGTRFGYGAARAERALRFNRAELARRLPNLLRKALAAEPTMLAIRPVGAGPVLPVAQVGGGSSRACGCLGTRCGSGGCRFRSCRPYQGRD